MLAIEADSKPNRTKIAILLSAMGPPNDPPNNPPVPDDDNQQGNAQPDQNNAAQANDNRNVLRSDVYADVVKRFELEFVGKSASYLRDIDSGFMRGRRNSTSTTTPRNYTHLLMRANLKSTKT